MSSCEPKAKKRLFKSTELRTSDNQSRNVRGIQGNGLYLARTMPWVGSCARHLPQGQGASPLQELRGLGHQRPDYYVNSLGEARM